MANALIAFGNQTDGGLLSGGAWRATLPLTNLQDHRIGKVARSADLSLTSTKFSIDIGLNKTVRVINLVGHNLSLTARYRITTTGVDTGWRDVWPVVFDSSNLEWESVNWWTGKFVVDQIQGFTWNLMHIFDGSTPGQVWTVELDDGSNSAGFVQIGRLFIGDAWQPKVNMDYGAGIGWETDTDVQKALSGAEFPNRRTPYRVVRCSTSWMSEDEGMGNAFDIQRLMGIDGEICFVWDPDDTLHAIRRQFLARLRTLSPVENPYVAIHKTAWEIKELI